MWYLELTDFLPSHLAPVCRNQLVNNPSPPPHPSPRASIQTKENLRDCSRCTSLEKNVPADKQLLIGMMKRMETPRKKNRMNNLRPALSQPQLYQFKTYSHLMLCKAVLSFYALLLNCLGDWCHIYYL